MLMSLFISLSRAIDSLNEKVANAVSWALLAAVIICAVSAIARYSLNIGSNAWREIQWYLYAAMFLLASAHTLRRDEHVRVDVVAGRFSRRTQVWIDLFGFFLFLLPMCIVMLWYGTPYALSAIHSGEMSTDAGGLIVWPARLLIPVGFMLILLQGLSEIIKRIVFLSGRSDGSDFAKQVTTPQDEIDAIKAANKLS